MGEFYNDVEVITQVITEICNQEIDTDDGLVFDTKEITGIKIKEDADSYFRKRLKNMDRKKIPQ